MKVHQGESEKRMARAFDCPERSVSQEQRRSVGRRTRAFVVRQPALGVLHACNTVQRVPLTAGNGLNSTYCLTIKHQGLRRRALESLRAAPGHTLNDQLDSFRQNNGIKFALDHCDATGQSLEQ